MIVMLGGKALFEWAGPLDASRAFGSVTSRNDGVGVVHALSIPRTSTKTDTHSDITEQRPMNIGEISG